MSSSSLQTYRMFIDGEFVEACDGSYLESYNPFTAEPWALIPRGKEADAHRAVEAAKAAFERGEWARMSATGRGHLLRRLGDLIAEQADRLAEIEVCDNGKLITEMKAQLNYLPQWYYYFGGLADKIEGSVLPIDKPEYFTYTLWEPLGVVVAIVPWNSPLLLATYKIAPALAAGNTVVIKPSEYTSASMLEMVTLIQAAGFPKGVVNVVTGLGAEIGDALVSHPDVAKIAFTGSDRTGTEVYSKAAQGIKRVTLELGGKSPNIVFADANLDEATAGAVSGIFAATGQTCIAGSRLLVQRNIHDELVERIVKMAGVARMGNPLDADTQIGPVTNPAQLEKILRYLDTARDDGATVALGGTRATRPECGTGWFVEPTIFTGVSNRMRIAQEEVFGPVLSVIPFEDEDEAIAIGNDILYGLAAGIWTTDLRRAMRLPKRLKAGIVWINTYRAVSFMAPFGGYKRSGFGRECGQHAIREYLQQKTVWVSTESGTTNPFVVR